MKRSTGWQEGETRESVVTWILCPGSSVNDPYSLKIASGLARMPLNTQVRAITPKHMSFRNLVSRWYTIHL